MHEGEKWHHIVIVCNGFEKKRMLLVASVDFAMNMAGWRPQAYKISSRYFDDVFEGKS